MNVFNKVTLESLEKNRTRTIVTIIGIMLSAAMICASTTLVSSMRNFVLRCAIHIDGDWYGAVYDAAYKDYEDIRDSDRVFSAAYAQVLGYAKIDSANERKPYLYVLGGDVASGYFETMPVHLILGALPKDSTEIILPEHLTSNGKVNYKLGDTVTLDVGDRTLDGRRLGQDTPVYTYDSETQVEIMSGERLEPRTYTVVGIYERPTFEDYSAPGYTALTAADTKSADQSLIHCYFKLHKPAGVYSALLLPNRTGVISVSISCDDERETITDKREIDSLFANLSTVRIKSGESYNDSPMTDKFIKIFFEVSDGLSGCVVYVFEDENGFFIEQPYNGIFSIEEKQYTEILGLLF